MPLKDDEIIIFQSELLKFPEQVTPCKSHVYRYIGSIVAYLSILVEIY